MEKPTEPTFSWENDGFEPKTNFFLGKCGFQWKNRPFPRKKMVLGQNHLLPRKELVFQSKTRFFLGKVCASLLFPYTSFLFVRV